MKRTLEVIKTPHPAYPKDEVYQVFVADKDRYNPNESFNNQPDCVWVIGACYAVDLDRYIRDGLRFIERKYKTFDRKKSEFNLEPISIFK